MTMTEEKTIYGYTNYNTAVNWLNSNLILCNDIQSVDEGIYDNMRFNFYGDDEDENPIEIFQWYLTSLSESDVEYLERVPDSIIPKRQELLKQARAEALMMMQQPTAPEVTGSQGGRIATSQTDDALIQKMQSQDTAGMLKSMSQMQQ